MLFLAQAWRQAVVNVPLALNRVRRCLILKVGCAKGCRKHESKMGKRIILLDLAMYKAFVDDYI